MENKRYEKRNGKLRKIKKHNAYSAYSAPSAPTAPTAPECRPLEGLRTRATASSLKPLATTSHH